jgi:hypothetical protein
MTNGNLFLLCHYRLNFIWFGCFFVNEREDKIKYKIFISRFYYFVCTVSNVIMLVVCMSDAFVLDPLASAILIGIGFIPFLIVSSLYVASFEDPIFLCLAFVVSFVFYTLLVLIVVRITLYLKKRLWLGKASLRCQ